MPQFCDSTHHRARTQGFVQARSPSSNAVKTMKAFLSQQRKVFKQKLFSSWQFIVVFIALTVHSTTDDESMSQPSTRDTIHCLGYSKNPDQIISIIWTLHISLPYFDHWAALSATRQRRNKWQTAGSCLTSSTLGMVADTAMNLMPGQSAEVCFSSTAFNEWTVFIRLTTASNVAPLWLSDNSCTQSTTGQHTKYSEPEIRKN